MKKVYGLLIVLVLFVGCFSLVMADEGEVIELFSVKRGEIILKAKYESLDGQIVPKYIVTNKVVRIYKNGKEVKEIYGDGLYPITCTDDGEYFLCMDNVEKDSWGAPEACNIKVYNSNGILLKDKRKVGYAEYMSITKHQNSWLVYEWSTQEQYARIINESSEKYLIDGYENSESVYDIKVGLSGLVVISRKSLDQNWVLRSFDFDGNVHWKQEYFSNRSREPILLVNRRGCFVFYPVKDQSCFRGYDETGTLLIEQFEKYGEKSGYIRGTINEDYVYFSNSNVLTRFNMEKKKVDRTLTLDSDIKSLYTKFDSLFVWRTIRDSNNRSKGVFLDCFENDILKENMLSFNLPTVYDANLKNIVNIGNYILVIQSTRIFAIKIK